MAHDKFCTYVEGLGPEDLPVTGLQLTCICDILREVRKDEKAKWVVPDECWFSPDGRHGKFKFSPEKDLCGYCSEDVSRLFEMGQ